LGEHPLATNGNGNAKEIWLRKAISEIQRDAVDRIVMLIPSDTSTHWFHDYVLEASAICFMGPGRVCFEGGDRNPSFGLLMLAFGDVTDDLAEAMDAQGAVFRGRTAFEPSTQSTLPFQGGDGSE